MIVVDASVVVDAVIGHGSAAERLAARDLAAPHLLDAEVGSALRGQVRRGDLDPGRAERALGRLSELAVDRYGHWGLLARAWELRSNVSFYDALYVALAERLDAPLVTADGRLARASGLRATIEVVPGR